MTAKIVGGQKIKAGIAAAAARAKSGKQVDVGFFPDATYPNGTSVAQVAFWDEYGTRTAPPRPFMRPVAKEGENTWGGLAATALKHTNSDAGKALEIIGRQIQGEVRSQVEKTVAPADSMVTNLLKQRFPMGGYEAADVWQAFHDVRAGETAPEGKVLVWTGRLLNSVEYEVKK